MTTETEATAPKPLPVPNELTRPFWEAARQERLVIQRCKDCRYYNHPPKPACDNCMSENLGFEPVSGRGTIWSRTVMYHKNVPGFENDVPYLNVVVELEEQPDLLMITNLPGSAPEDGKVGTPVEVVFQRINDEITLPQFRIASD
jgi:uncharacterized OB-fold protein